MPAGSRKKQNILPAISRILVATDFSSQAETALRWARRLADEFGARIVLLHVVDVCALGAAGFALVGPGALPSLLAEASQDMKNWQEMAPGAEAVIREGEPRPLIVDAALELKCQLIVMGTHGRSGLAHLLMGSVAEYVVRYSKVPVLTVRKH
jgi:nucleotide-binding universal stress UspA family protein